MGLNTPKVVYRKTQYWYKFAIFAIHIQYGTRPLLLPRSPGAPAVDR